MAYKNKDGLIEYLTKQQYLHKGNAYLFHYTNLDAMVKILETKSLWATNCEYLNDMFDVKHIISIFNDMAKKPESFKVIIEELKMMTNDNIYAKFLKKTFIISFTEERDSVAMWKNYSRSGIIMVFNNSPSNKENKKETIKFFDKENKPKYLRAAKLLGKIIYDPELMSDYILNLIGKITKNIEEKRKTGQTNNSTANEINNITKLLQLCLLYKNKSYSFENEIRMAFTIIDDNDIGNIEKYRIKSNLLIPYLDISFEENGKLPLKGVIINPEQKDYMYTESIRRLLNSYNYDIPIIKSKNRIRY